MDGGRKHPSRQRRGRNGPLRSTLVDGMVSAYHALDVGASVFGSDTRRNRRTDSAKKGAAGEGWREQFGAFQGAPQSAVQLSCAEIRHLFWQLVLAVERSVAGVLKWSSWRRWHQAWARWYHSRKRAGDASVEVMQTDGWWQALPSQFPGWKTVYAQYSQWRKAGIWDRIWTKSAQRFSSDELQL